MTNPDDKLNYKEMNPGELYQYLGMDGKKWADYFISCFPEVANMPDTINSWFCNAIMAGYDTGRNEYESILQEAKAQLEASQIEQEVAVESFNEMKAELDNLLAKVCVLEVGNRPEVGDIVKLVNNSGAPSFHQRKRLFAQIEAINEYDAVFVGEGRSGYPIEKIIQRNGLPVIYKESAVVADNNQTIKGKLK